MKMLRNSNPHWRTDSCGCTDHDPGGRCKRIARRTARAREKAAWQKAATHPEGA